jgi:pilus assembly protein FimV
MVFGFGFNKAKVLASAERNVKSGKLHNAIADYEKILKEDERDLTVMNTVGDLYARVGNSEKAIAYFRKVGEIYAGDGFTVKAIAMFKKLTKQDPNALDAVKKLAELYTQQGLYTDARSQYMHLAEHKLRNNEPQAAADIFNRILELDPENVSLQGRLAEIYGRIGRKAEARDLYFRTAEALRGRGALDGADEALGNAIRIDPKFSEAVALRGRIKLDMGDPEGAISTLEKLPDIDSRPDALQALLKALLKTRNLSEAEPVARKLVKVFNDISGIADYADALIANGECEQALQFYRDHADLLFMSNMGKVTEVLQSTIARVKSNANALEILADLFHRSGNTGNLTEVTELLAHNCAAAGDSARAGELYQKLMSLEPDNPQHEQNYRQVTARTPESTSAQETDEKAARCGGDEVQISGRPVDQEYSAAVKEFIDEALTDAELFESYNLPAKAVPPLEGALKRAPRDIRVNLRLVPLYARCGRLKEAVQRCIVLESVYRDAGQNSDAEQFAALAAKYRQRAGLADNSELIVAPASPQEEATVAPQLSGLAVPPVVADPPAPTQDSAPSAPAEPVAALETIADRTHEFDLSDEWEQMLEVEEEAEPPSTSPVRSAAEVPSTAVGQAGSHSVAVFDTFDEEEPKDPASAYSDLIDEIHFYLQQSMWTEAAAALRRLENAAPSLPVISELKSQLAAADLTRDNAGQEQETELITDFLPEVSAVDASMKAPALIVPETIEATPERPTPEVTSEPAASTEAPAVSSDDPFGGLVFELDKSLGDDFELPVEQPSIPLPLVTVPEPARVAAMAAAAAAPVASASFTSAAVAVPVPVPHAPAVDLSLISEEEAPSMLGDIFNEFKQSMEAGADSQEDPETHYNLGVAFKEMGLLDEAIGELQKVCQAIEHGHAFPQAMQAYTWLADSFLQKGVPEAAVRWYEKALKSNHIDDDTATAIHYELACAQEAAGERSSALKHFMEVYGTNIDYRDVAERIKALKA